MYKFEGKSLYVNVNKGKKLLVGLAVGDNKLFVCRLKIAPPIIVGAWPMAVLLWQHVEYILRLEILLQMTTTIT